MNLHTIWHMLLRHTCIPISPLGLATLARANANGLLLTTLARIERALRKTNYNILREKNKSGFEAGSIF